MKKAIAIVSQHAELQAVERDFDARIEALQERRKFLEKQAQDLVKERHALIDQLNVKRVDWARNANLLPADFDSAKHHFHQEGGALVVCDETFDPVGGLLNRLFGGPHG